MPHERLSEHLYLVGNSNLSHPLDCNVYLIDGRPTECVLIDSGCGLGVDKILQNIRQVGIDLGLVSAVVNTHCHYRHAGGNFRLNKMLGYCEVIIHELDAPAVEQGDPSLTGASFYKQRFDPCKVDVRAYTDRNGSMKQIGFGDKLWISAGNFEFAVIPTAGHTPGSTSVYGELDGSKVLFSGDVNRAPTKAVNASEGTWKRSIEKLLELDIDTLCTGHQVVKEEPKKWLKSLLKE